MGVFASVPLLTIYVCNYELASVAKKYSGVSKCEYELFILSSVCVSVCFL